MFLTLLLRFYLRRAYNAYPAQLTGLVVSLSVLAGVLSGLAGLYRQANLVTEETNALLQNKRSVQTIERPAVVAIELPQMQSAAVVKNFNGIADDLHLPLEEVAYALDNTDRAPYLKYRITLTTRAGYGDIRKFLAVVSAEMPNAALDSIRCSRTDAAAPALGCELAFSAFFSKANRG